MSEEHSSQASQAACRSALMQLIGKGFAHPEPDFHRNLLDSAYQEAVASLDRQLGGQTAPLVESHASLADYEACYIKLFQHGRKGRPAVSLRSGDYPELLAGKTRGEHMLDCLAWYTHFGLELPNESKPAADHVVCQFDFLAWLAYLEDGVVEQPELAEGYRRAQQDFLEIQLLPHLRIMQCEFSQLDGQGETMEGFDRLIRLALDVAERTFFYLDQPRVMRSSG